MASEVEAKPYLPWLEDMVKSAFEISPVSMAVEMIDEDGYVYTFYYNATQDNFERMISAMRDDNRLQFIRDNKDLILEILATDDDEEDDEEGDDG